MVIEPLAGEWLQVAADIPVEAEGQQGPAGIGGQHPVEMVGPVGELVEQQDGSMAFKIGHAVRIVGPGGSRGRVGVPIIAPMPTNRIHAVAVLLTIGVLGLGLTGCAQERSAGEIRESANTAYDRGDYAKALAEWEEYARVHPVPLASDLGRGKALLALERPGDAIIPLERVYRDDPMNQEKLQLLIEALYGAGEHDELISLLRDRTRQPGTVEEYLRLGRYAEEIGDPDEAERALLTAARIDRGQSVEPQLKLAEFYHGIGDTERALERYAMALWFDYSDPTIGERIRSLGKTPGRTFVRVPREAVEEGLLAPDAAPPEPEPRG